MSMADPSPRKPRARSPSVVIRRPSSIPTSTAPVWKDEGHFPRHLDVNWRHAVPRASEDGAIRAFKNEWRVHSIHSSTWDGKGKAPLYIELSDYEIYNIAEDDFFCELHSLDFMDAAGKKLRFNGVLSFGSVRCYVQNLTVKNYSIEGYGDDSNHDTIIYIVSTHAAEDQRFDIWYRLRSPSRQYAKFHDAFQWLSILGKHAVDYMEFHEDVSLESFRQDFKSWLERRFADNADFSRWAQSYGAKRKDFRKPIHAYISYLWTEASCLVGNLCIPKTILQHPLWDECANNDGDMIKAKCEKTIATPHVYQFFKNRYFASQLMEVPISSAIYQLRRQRIKALGLSSEIHGSSAKSLGRRIYSDFKVGEVISILPDEDENEVWHKSAKDKSTIREWYAYIQRIEPCAKQQRLFVIWLYRPENTTISTTDYPINQELFISDNCNCEEAELMSSDIYRKYDVEWFARGPSTKMDFFVRQKWIQESCSFITMDKADFVCDCHRSNPKPSFASTCHRGDTVYLSERRVLEPVLVESVDTDQKKVTVRRLRRLTSLTRNMLPQRPIAPSVLAWTNELQVVSYERIHRKCFVRFSAHADTNTIPFPYDRAGDYWILSKRLINSQDQHRLEDLLSCPKILNEGPDFSTAPASNELPGLSLFSGIGNLDKGMEAAGAARFHTFIDMNGRAIQTLSVNAENTNKPNLYFGSVDDHLLQLLTGKGDPRAQVAKIGEVGIITAGSPCPGFSKLQQDWQSAKSLRNASHVTTIASFIDVYRPEYAFLENVVNMGSVRKGFEDEQVLAQLVGCLVAMGYQVQQHIMSSWNYGSWQHRNRIILSIAAPGRTPITPPSPTHSDVEGMKSRSVGRLLNGQRYGIKDDDILMPFPHATAEQAIGDLPNIGYGVKHPCIRFPDHRLRVKPSIKHRRIMACIPISPSGCNLESAIKRRLVPEYLYSGRKEIGNKSFKRIARDGLVGTIVTGPSPHDSRSGPFMHYEQNRSITLEEARRAQGIPDDMVLIGSIADQFKMVGNAVDRHVSNALGLALRQALDQNQKLDKDKRLFRRHSLVEIRIPSAATTKRRSGVSMSYRASEDTTIINASGISHQHSVTELNIISEALNSDDTVIESTELLHVQDSGTALADTGLVDSAPAIDTVTSDDEDSGPVLPRPRRTEPRSSESLQPHSQHQSIQIKRFHGSSKSGDESGSNRSSLGAHKRLKQENSDVKREMSASLSDTTCHSEMTVDYVPSPYSKRVEKDIRDQAKAAKQVDRRPYA